MSTPDAATAAVEADRSFRRWTIGAVLFASLVRARYLFEPLAPDEGGYLALARAWAGGGALYTRFWVDRPQGMMTLIRLGDHATGPGNGFLRVLAVVLGISSIVAVAWMARRISGRWQAGAVAAVFVALLSSSPAIEGFTANGELMAAAFAVPGMAVTVAVLTDRLSIRWLFIAGALAGLALSVKQSGYDGLVGTCLWFGLAWWFQWRRRSELVGMFLVLMAGLATVIGLLLLQGTVFGFSEYWYAIVGFRIGSRSAVSSPQWARLGITASITLGLTVGMIALAFLRLRQTHMPLRTWFDRHNALAVCWLTGAGLALMTGGNYHRHYWITVSFPLALVLALMVAGVATSESDEATTPASRWPIAPRELALACVVPLVVTAVLMVAPGLEQDARLHQDQVVSDWVDDHDSDNNGTLLPVCGSASYHTVADQTPPYPYLWVDNIVAADDAVPKMVDLLDDPDGPAFVARFQPVTDCDESGRIEAAIRRNFESIGEIDGIEVLEHIDR
ncbi:MAG: hypothetical protein ABI239_01820 [Aquihabitans sp.]